MKIAVRILIVLMILALLPVFFADRLARKYTVEIIQEQTGFSVNVEDIHVDVFRSVVHVKNLVLTNPPEFPHPDAVAIRELYVKYDVLSLFREQIHIKVFKIDLDRLVLVKPRHQRSNLAVLARMDGPDVPEQGSAGKPTPPPQEPTNPSPSQKPPSDKSSRRIKIDELNVKLGEMEVRQYREPGNEPSVINVQIGIDRTMYGVTNIQTVVRQLSSDVMISSGLGFLSQLDTKSKSGKVNPEEVMDKVKKQLEEIKDRYFK